MVTAAAEEEDKAEEDDEPEPVVKIILLEVELPCEVVFANATVDVFLNCWAEAEPIRARADTTIAALIATCGWFQTW